MKNLRRLVLFGCAALLAASATVLAGGLGEGACCRPDGGCAITESPTESTTSAVVLPAKARRAMGCAP